MSRPGAELFPESAPQKYNSYMDQPVGDPLNTGVTADVAGQPMESDQQMNFRAMRGEISKMQGERDYWRGQAEAYSKISQDRPEPAQATPQADAFAALDLGDPSDVKKAFDTLRHDNAQLQRDNQELRTEIRDSLNALQTKTQRQDWNTMVTQHVPQLTSKNPIFAEMIQKVSNPYEAAYLLAELNARAGGPNQQQQQHIPEPRPQEGGYGQRAVSNAMKPQTLASVGGQGQLSAADYYASMSDEDFMKIAARNLANI